MNRRLPQALLAITAAAALGYALASGPESVKPGAEDTSGAVGEAVERYREEPGAASGAALLDAAQRVERQRDLGHGGASGSPSRDPR